MALFRICLQQSFLSASSCGHFWFAFLNAGLMMILKKQKTKLKCIFLLETLDDLLRIIGVLADLNKYFYQNDDCLVQW